MPNPYKPHIEIAHAIWLSLVQPGDLVIDATCGNGHDTLYLAQIALKSPTGMLYGLDVQPDAIFKTRSLLETHLTSEALKRIKLIVGCHSQFPEEIVPNSIKLIVYNLGYLPGGVKSLTTSVDTTLKSLEHAMRLIQVGGLICITCYPGHEAGKEEEAALINFTATLNPRQWNCSHQRWVNRLNSPSLLLLGACQLS